MSEVKREESKNAMPTATSNTKFLRAKEIQVLLSLKCHGDGEARLRDIKNTTCLSAQYIRNALTTLRRLGYVTSFRGSSLRILQAIDKRVPPGKKNEALYTLTKPFEEIVKEHPEILEWCKAVLKANSIEEALIKYSNWQEKLK